MERGIRVSRAGQWPASAARDVLTLAYEERRRRRTRLRTDSGGWMLLDLPDATLMRDGDGILLEDGGWLAVRAAPETLAEITSDDPERLTAIAWHLGNRHLPTQIEAGHLLIRDDRVITEMVRLLGGAVRVIEAPFDPEAGAYESQPHPHAGRDHA